MRNINGVKLVLACMFLWCTGGACSPESFEPFTPGAPQETVQPEGRLVEGERQITASTSALLIVAPKAWQAEVQRLLWFKYKSGRLTYQLYLEDIEQQFSGQDQPERVKKAIAHWAKHYYVKNVLLVGDADVFPVRYVSRYLESFTPSDLYYADLWKADGSFSSWDDKHNGVFGEMKHDLAAGVFWNLDGADWTPDVAVGRVPASSLVELRRYVDKVIRYEKGQAHAGWYDMFRRALLLTGQYTDAEKDQEYIAKSYLTDFEIIRRYHPEGASNADFGQRVQLVREHLNHGVGLINFLGHGEPSGWSWVFNSCHLYSDCYNLDPQYSGKVHNISMTPIVFSNGCNTGGFAPVAPSHDYVDVNGIKHAGGATQATLAQPRPIQPKWCATCDREAMPEAWLVERGVGAVAFVAPVGAGNPDYATEMSKKFFAAYKNGARTFGELWKQMITTYVKAHTDAQGNILYSGNDPHWNQKAIWNMLVEFNAFGDPSLQLGGLVGTDQRDKLAARIGCFKDTSVRDLPFLSTQSSQLTVQMCVWRCRDRGYLFAGVQNGKQCYCGNSYGVYGPSSACTKPCTGEPGKTCGGAWANEVYAVPLGCFKDGTQRDLELLAATSSSMTVQKCRGLCRGKGYRYAGLQHGKQCFCGNSYGKYHVSSSCTKPCTGDAKQTCGGYWSNLVFPVSLGCYRDTADRDLPHKVPATYVTVDFCLAECKIRGYRYAALQNGNGCFCGDTYGAYGPSDKCDRPCNGDAAQLCGGAWANEIYTTH